MIIWFGHGILIPLIAILGFFAGTVLGGVISVKLGMGTRWAGVFGMFFAALSLHLYGRTIGKTVRAPDGSVVRRHSFFFVTGFWWSMIAFFLGVLGAATVLRGPGEEELVAARERAAEFASSPQALAFKSADNMILTDKEGAHHGNTSEAKELARKFSLAAKGLREMGIESGKKGSISLTGGEFLTYCHQTPSELLFMAHVPKFRKFSGGAKEFMMEASWAAAKAVASQLDHPPQRLGVGLKGVVLYEQVWAGSLEEGEEGPDWRASHQMTKSEEEKELLYSFFEEKSPPKKLTGDAEPADLGALAATGPAASASASVEPEPVAEPSLTLPSESREWHSANGKSFVGSLTDFEGGRYETANFSGEGGKRYTVPIEKFAAADKDLLLRYFEAAQKP